MSMNRRVLTATLGAALALLAGCSAGPQPAPSPSSFPAAAWLPRP